MEIQPTYITFEQAKFLYSIGAKFQCDGNYYTNEGRDGLCQIYSPRWKNIYGGKNPDIPRSQHWEVIEWLRVKHEIHIKYEPTIKEMYQFYVYHLGSWIHIDCVNIISEGYSAAFDYVLKNLI